MVCARVIVLPDPVTPSSVWYLSPRASPAVSSAMALGWSPAGSNGARTWKRFIGSNITVPVFLREAERTETTERTERLAYRTSPSAPSSPSSPSLTPLMLHRTPKTPPHTDPHPH